MTIINFNVRIKAGKRTPVEVNVSSKSVNPKILTLTSGIDVTEIQIIKWLQRELKNALSQVERIEKHE